MMTVIDGNKIAEEIISNLKGTIATRNLEPKLNIILVGDNPVSQQYINLKIERGSAIGIEVIVHHLATSAITKDILLLIDGLSTDSGSGIIVQLPLPSDTDKSKVLSAIPLNQDVDQLHRVSDNSHPFVQPVAASVSEILSAIDLDWSQLNSWPEGSVHVIGKGFLVGDPVISLLRSQGVDPVVYERGDDLSGLRQAKLIISGTGVANLVKPDFISEGVVLIDAGTSSDSGEVVGDIDPTCYSLASYYTPVPGGVGPITLAKLFENVVTLSSSIID